MGVDSAPIVLRERYRLPCDCCNNYVSLIPAYLRVTLLFRPRPSLQTHCLTAIRGRSIHTYVHTRARLSSM